MTSAAIKRMVSGYPRRVWNHQPLIMLQAYCDDSHASGGLRPLYLSAYVLDAARWIEFSDAWDVVLRQSPAIAYFKMTEGTRREGCFEGFTISDRNAKVFALAEVIKAFGPWCLHARVNTVEFDSILKPHAPPPFRTPYFSLCYAVINAIANIHKGAQIRQPCELIFDDHPGLAAKVLPIFDFMMDERPDWALLIAGKPAFKDDKDVMPLQACDMLAWAIRRKDEGMAAPDFDGLLQKIVPKGLNFESEITKDALQAVADMWKRDQPEFGSITKKEWDAMMVRLHNSRALSIWLASR